MRNHHVLAPNRHQLYCLGLVASILQPPSTDALTPQNFPLALTPGNGLHENIMKF